MKAQRMKMVEGLSIFRVKKSQNTREKESLTSFF